MGSYWFLFCREQQPAFSLCPWQHRAQPGLSDLIPERRGAHKRCCGLPSSFAHRWWKGKSWIYHQPQVAVPSHGCSVSLLGKWWKKKVWIYSEIWQRLVLLVHSCTYLCICCFTHFLNSYICLFHVVSSADSLHWLIYWASSSILICPFVHLFRPSVNESISRWLWVTVFLQGLVWDPWIRDRTGEGSRNSTLKGLII